MQSDTTASSLVVRAVRLAFLTLPVIYMAGIFGSVVHEVVGHGLAAILLGGEFHGFKVQWDTMAWAYAGLPDGASLSRQILYLASGTMATTLFGLILWGLVRPFRRSPAIQLVLLIAAFVVLIDGFSYILWDAWKPFPRGDLGRIIWMAGGPLTFEGIFVQWSLLLTSTALFAGATFYFCRAIFIRIEALILQEGQFSGLARIIALTVFLVLPSTYEWLSYDWNQINPGIGRLPQVVGVLSVVAAAAMLFRHRPKLKYDGPIPPITWRIIAVSWTYLIVAIATMALRLVDGVRF